MIRKCVIHQWMNRATGGAFGYPIFNPWLVLSSQVVEIIPLHMGSAQNLPWDALPWIDGSRIHHHPMGIQTVSEHLDALGICIVLECIRYILTHQLSVCAHPRPLSPRPRYTTRTRTRPAMESRAGSIPVANKPHSLCSACNVTLRMWLIVIMIIWLYM